MTSVMTATTEVVISEKSMLEFFRSDFSGIAVSRISVMRIKPIRPSLLHFDVGVLDDLAPFGDLHLDPGGELLGGVGDRLQAEADQAVPHVRQRDDAGDL